AAYVVNWPDARYPFTRTVETKHATGQRIGGTVVSEEYPGAPHRHYPVPTVDRRFETQNERYKQEVRARLDRPVCENAKGLGADDAALYLADYEQRVLVPVPNRNAPEREEVVIDTTLAGRCYRTLQIQSTTSDDGGLRVWAPVLDGVERLGVLELAFGATEPNLDEVRVLAGLLAEVVMTKQAYGDLIEQVRRRQPMSVAAELAWRLLPPLTFGTDQLVISGVLAPVYQLGGDSFDYAVDAHTARIAIFDAMGHGLEAGLLASVAMAALRTSRRAGSDLAETAAAIDGAVSAEFGPDRFVTAVLAELELASGRLRWSVSGHPPPLLLRNGRIVKTLVGEVVPPLGVSGAVVVNEETLEPGDQVLFFTDGVVEARSASGEFFGVDRLVDMVTRTSAAAIPAPETMRRLLHAILDHQEGELQDDATIVVVEWHSPGGHLLEL
ncbi:MAG: SpoIIE family protein phosphatase, partial [Actinomycetota bacterium]|nr:SpoIIE family protein phosphatase [Actinomycetota bacterium]